jgi:hypothetical protein
MPRRVLVKWRDAKLIPDCLTLDEIADKQLSTFETIGYLISQDAITTKIASELNGEAQYREITLIPTGSIISIRRLSLASFM